MANMSAFDFIGTLDADTVELDKADESAILLAALEDACTPEEFAVIMENSTELELYGLIESASIATEAKRIVYKQTKQMNLNREQSKAAFRLAKKAGAACWKGYHKARVKMIKFRNEIFDKFGPRAKSEAKRVVSGARKKASAMSGNTVTGKTISEKLDKKVKEYNQ